VQDVHRGLGPDNGFLVAMPVEQDGGCLVAQLQWQTSGRDRFGQDLVDCNACRCNICDSRAVQDAAVLIFDR
jgi:hypothetical protein